MFGVGGRAGSYAGGCAETMLDMKYPHTALDVITDYPPPSLITSARMNHELPSLLILLP